MKNREIKFRGKVVDIDVWVYGSYFNASTGATIIEDGGDKMTDFNFVYSDSLGQFTGLKDKNGKDVYEGDIIRWNLSNFYWEAKISTIKNSKSNTLYAIETFHNCTEDEEGGIYTYQRSNSRNGFRNDIEFISKNVEIIGNIHENPELLNS